MRSLIARMEVTLSPGTGHGGGIPWESAATHFLCSSFEDLLPRAIPCPWVRHATSGGFTSEAEGGGGRVCPVFYAQASKVVPSVASCRLGLEFCMCGNLWLISPWLPLESRGARCNCE